MTKEEMKNYLMSTGLYENTDADMFYEERMMDTNKTIPISELVERFIDVDKEFNGESWKYSTDTYKYRYDYTCRG